MNRRVPTLVAIAAIAFTAFVGSSVRGDAATAPSSPWSQTNADAAGRRGDIRPWEERNVSSGRSSAIGIEQVIDMRGILVDALLDQPHTQNTNIEIEVLLGIAGNRSDMMNAMNRGLHIYSSMRVCIPPINASQIG